MSSNYQPRRNSLNRSLQFEQSGQAASELMLNDSDVNQNYNSGHHNRFARIMHNNYNHNSNVHKNSLSYDNHYSTLDESVLNYTNNAKDHQGNNGQTYITPIKNILFQKMNNFNSNNLTTSNNNNYIYNNNLVSLSLEQPKRNKPRKNNIKSSLTQAEKVYSTAANNSHTRPNPIQIPGVSKDKKSKLDIESLQNRILNEGARGYTVKDSFNNIIVNYAPNINQVNTTTGSSSKLSSNNIKNGLQQNGFPQSTRQNSNGNQIQQSSNINVKEALQTLNRSFKLVDADRATNLTMGSASKNSDNLNTTMTNNRCSSMMSFHEEIPHTGQTGGYTNHLINSADMSGNILDNLIGNDIDISHFKDKQSTNGGSVKPLQVQQGNQMFLKQSEIKYINSIKQKMNQGDNNNNNNTQSVSARYQSSSASNNQQQQLQDQKSLYNVTKNNRYGDSNGSNGEQTSKSNNSIKSILTEKRKYKIDENQQIQINNINISYNQLNRSNPSAPNHSSQGQKFILKENNPNITLDSSLAVESQKINFDNYNIHTSNSSGGQGGSQQFNQQSQNNKSSNNNLYLQNQSSSNNNRYNHHVNLHQQLTIGNSNTSSTNNHTSKSINIVNRSSNFTSTTNQNNQKNRDYSYDSIQYDQLPSQQQQYSFILNPHSSAQYNTISHNSGSGGFGSSKGSTSGPKRKKIQIHSKLLNNSHSNIGSIIQNNSTTIGIDSSSASSVMKQQKTPDNIDRSNVSSQIQRIYKIPSSQISQNQNQNQNLLLLLQKVQECFNRFKGRQDQINNGQQLDKKVMEQLVNKYVSQNLQNNDRQQNKSPNKLSQSDRSTPAAVNVQIAQKSLEKIKNKIVIDKSGYQIKSNEEDGKSEINDRSTTLNSNNSYQINKQGINGSQSSASNVTKSPIPQHQTNPNQYKFHKIGLNMISRLFKKKYSAQFFIQLIKNQNNSRISC